MSKYDDEPGRDQPLGESPAREQHRDFTLASDDVLERARAISEQISERMKRLSDRIKCLVDQPKPTSAPAADSASDVPAGDSKGGTNAT